MTHLRDAVVFLYWLGYSKWNRVYSPNSGCLLNIGNGPQTDPSIYNGAKDSKAAHHCVMRPKAETWLIINPVFGKHPEFGEFTLYVSVFYGVELFLSSFPTFPFSLNILILYFTFSIQV